MRIRPAVPADIEGIRAVGEAGWWGTYSEYRTPGYIQAALDRWWSTEYLLDVIGSERHVLLVAGRGARRGYPSKSRLICSYSSLVISPRA